MNTDDSQASQQARFEAILAQSRQFGDGGREVLETAYHTLAAGRAICRWPQVGLEDLWAHAIKEGRGLFADPEARWSKTGPRQTRDMIGQTTIGPWQITVANVKNKYGQPYGVLPDWPDGEVFEFCRSRPPMQAGMICDYMQEAYSQYGQRTPYAIQKYFWLEAYVKGEIGRGPWDKSVLPDPPDGDWQKLTPEMKADTGFYAKQIVLGSKTNPHGLLWWLWVTGDTAGIQGVITAWRSQPVRTWDAARGVAVPTGEMTTEFAIQPADLIYLPTEACREAIQRLL